MRKKIHISMSVAGAIRQWTPSDWKRNAKLITIDDKYLTSKDLKNAFNKMLADGTKFLPISECDNFDPQSGCRGHELPD